MCGIVGVLSFVNHGGYINEEVYQDLLSALNVQRHRGPDDQGICLFSSENSQSQPVKGTNFSLPYGRYNGVLGFNRLSIKDLSSSGHQPMTGLDGKVILLFNGEIYNDRELRNELCNIGYTFRGTSDTEVLLNLYLDYYLLSLF